MLACKFWLIFQGLKSRNSVTAQRDIIKVGTLMPKYANMEGFCRDSHKCASNYFI